MLCGPDQIVGCPHCSKPARQPTIRMGNPVGVRVWTDGKQISPMEFEAPVVAVCLGCDHPFWLASAKILGEIDSLKGEEGVVDLDPLWLEAEHLEEPSEEEYHRAIAVGLATNPDQERTLRILTWWRENDSFREKAPTGSPHTATGPRRKNLEALSLLLGEAEVGERLMRAEVLRHLGKFELSRSLLAKTDYAPFGPIVEQMRCLCEAKDSLVRELYLVGE